MYKVAIIYTTFIRNDLMKTTTQSIVDNFPDNAILLIADQGKRTKEKDDYYNKLKNQISCEVHCLEFDIGAYFARNRLVERANELDCEFCLVMADSIGMIKKDNFQHVINFLNQDEKTALVGFELLGSKCPWEYLMEVTSNGIQFSYSNEHEVYGGVDYLRIDICRNIYLAKTKVLLTVPYDEELKFGGHELNFINLKSAGYKCYWTNHYCFQRYSSKPNEEYMKYRNRFSIFKNQAMKKLGVNGWVKMPKS